MPSNLHKRIKSNFFGPVSANSKKNMYVALCELANFCEPVSANSKENMYDALWESMALTMLGKAPKSTRRDWC